MLSSDVFRDEYLLRGGQVLHLAGLTSHIGGRVRSNHCNILYIAVIALSLC